MAIENKKVVSFTGMIGRKYYFINYMILNVILFAIVFMIGFCGGFFGTLMNIEKETQDLIIGMFVIPVWIVAMVPISSLMIRRLRDLFNLTNNDGWRDAALVLGFIFTGGFCFVGAIALLVWPGTLYNQSVAQQMTQINQAGGSPTEPPTTPKF